MLDFAKASEQELKDYCNSLAERITIVGRGLREGVLRREINNKTPAKNTKYLERKISEEELSKMTSTEILDYYDILLQEQSEAIWYLRQKISKKF